MMPMLSLRARGTALVPDIEAMDGGVRRFVGRHAEKRDGTLAWVPNETPDEKPYRSEYAIEVKHGNLEACNLETAAICGVPFVKEGA